MFRSSCIFVHFALHDVIDQFRSFEHCECLKPLRLLVHFLLFMMRSITVATMRQRQFCDSRDEHLPSCPLCCHLLRHGAGLDNAVDDACDGLTSFVGGRRPVVEELCFSSFLRLRPPSAHSILLFSELDVVEELFIFFFFACVSLRPSSC
jgi:hypothetical protein